MTTSFESADHISDDEAIALVDKIVSPMERARIDAHLDVCEACRELVAGMALAASVDGSEPPAISLDDSSGLPLSARSLDDSMQTQIYVSRPPAAEGAALGAGDMVGHFRIMRVLGRGAMGEVYVARDTMLGRKVALKVIAPDLLASERAMRRFLFEAKATARFNHPNIVTIHAVGEHGGRPYVALEYVEGENLHERTKKERLPLPEILRIGAAVADALAEAHAAGILHRDLKPANVVIGSDGRVRLLDFGLAKAVQAIDGEEPTNSSSSSSTWLVGTPRYMAPEQWRGGVVEGTADVWALGVILFELCAGGMRPFEANSTIDLLRMVSGAQLAPPLDTVAEVPAKLSQLVGACLHKDAHERPTAKELADGLHAIMQPARASLSITEAPFRGLLPFTERHADVFFGRDAEIAALLERMRIQPVLTLLGPSGAGKSSLIQAGVIPRLREQEGWVVLQLRPGPRPFETLAARLERRDSGVFYSPMPSPNDSGGRSRSLLEVEGRAEILRAAPRRLSVMLRELADAEDAKVLLFVDQLEEIFTTVDEVEQKRFLEAVCTAADDVDEPVRVVLALRHDFVDRLSTDGELGRALSRFIVLRAPDPLALRAILTEPVERAGFRYEDDRLVDQMIAAVQGEPSCLPLLQFAAARLWDQRDDEQKLLLRRVYDEMGGVGGALAKQADSLLAALSSEQRKTARTLLLRLVTPERTRRLVPRKTATEGLGRDADIVLKHLTEARLVSVSKMQRGDDLMLELAHGSLIHTWRTLAEWIEHSDEELQILGDATQAAELWDKRGRRAEELWGADALRDVDRGMRRASTPMPELVQHFLEASRREDKRRGQRKRLSYAGALVGLALVGGAAVVGSVFIVKSGQDDALAQQRALQEEAQAQQRRARSLIEGARQAVDDGHPLEARAQARRALELEDSNAARALERQLADDPVRLRRQLGTVGYQLAASGSTVAVASHERRVTLVSTDTGAVRSLEGHGDAVSAVAFIDEGRGLFAADLAGNLVVWDLERNRSRALAALGANLWGVAPSPDGRRVAVAGHLGVVVVDASTGKTLFARREVSMRSVVYANRGELIATGGDDGLVRFIGAGDGKLSATFDAESAVEALAVSPDGSTLAAATERGVVVIFDDGGRRRTVMAHPGARTLTFSPDGKRLASAGRDVVLVFDATTGREVGRFPLDERIFGASFLSDGRRLALVGEQQLVLVDLTLALEQPLTSHEGGVDDVAIAPDGKSVASSGSDGTVRIWDVEGGRVQREFAGHEGRVAGLAYSPDGATLATGTDRTIRLWDIAHGTTRAVLSGHEDVAEVAFSPDGKTVVSVGGDGTARAWSSGSGGLLNVFRGHEEALTDVAFSPDGTAFATSSLDETVRIWPTGGGSPTVTLRGHDGGVTSVAFDPSGEKLVSAAFDNTVRVWPASGGASRVVASLQGRSHRVAFHPDGKRVAAARADGAVLLGALNDAGPAIVLSGHTSDANAVDFDASGKLLVSASDDGTVRLWEVDGAKPAWRGVALVGSPARSFTHRGWERLDGAVPHDDAAAPQTNWARQIVENGQRAARASEGAPVCILRKTGQLELWDAHGDVLVGAVDGNVLELLALPSGCAGRTLSGVYVISQSGARRELSIGGAPLALGWGEQRLLVATPSSVVAFNESGERVGSHRHGGGVVTALTQIGSQLVLGHAHQNLTLVGTSSEDAPSAARFQRASGSAASKLTAGPNGTLVVGYADGAVGIFDMFDGALLLRRKLHGPVTHLMLENSDLFVVTELGDTLRVDLEFLTADYCEFLRGVWRDVPVVWEQGEVILANAPDGHPCR